ncbi:MAG TPA: hypothetical protein VHZ50_17320, partial [Puia sp.]|nr:hypothetical protein [Puia sp.]
MFLSSISFKEYELSPKHWEVTTFELQPINLIVGYNATGKSRLLRTIKGLADILFNSQKIPFEHGFNEVCFLNEANQHLHYKLSFDNSIIIKEELFINGENYMERNADGSGRIKNIQLNTPIDFKIPLNQVAIARRDSLQYPFLEDFFQWANSLRYFRFSSEVAK